MGGGSSKNYRRTAIEVLQQDSKTADWNNNSHFSLTKNSKKQQKKKKMRLKPPPVAMQLLSKVPQLLSLEKDVDLKPVDHLFIIIGGLGSSSRDDLRKQSLGGIENHLDLKQIGGFFPPLLQFPIVDSFSFICRFFFSSSTSPAMKIGCNYNLISLPFLFFFCS